MAALAFPSQVAPAYASNVKLPPAVYQSDCSDDLPVVVASDTAAQSDIYSAVTLAGALGTDCVVLAAPRHEPMPSDQAERLAAANDGGYVVGGTAAVPDWKVSGRSMVRISGKDRWATAEQVGDEAKKVGAGDPSTPRAIQGERPETDPAAGSERASRLKLPPAKYTGDCAGDVPVVVASDAAAQSDIYSAVTLAGALGTDCVVLAGARGSAVPDDQQARLAEAAAGGYVVGGTAALPECKVSGRSMVRIAGADRWATAERVGAEAKLLGAGSASAPRAIPEGECAPVSSTTTTTVPTTTTTVPTTVGPYKAVEAGLYVTCAIRQDDTVVCFGRDADNKQPPTGKFKSISGKYRRWCGIKFDDTARCWGPLPDSDSNLSRIIGTQFAKIEAAGKLKAVSVGKEHACVIKADDTVDCFGVDGDGDRAGFADRNAWIDSWATSDDQAAEPAGKFKSISAADGFTCGIRFDGTIHCWGWGENPPRTTGDSRKFFLGIHKPPSGAFKSVAAGGGGIVSTSVRFLQACATRADGTISCWGNHGAIHKDGGDKYDCEKGTNKSSCWDPERGKYDLQVAPAGRYTTVSAGARHFCGIRPDRTAHCWGNDNERQAPAPSALGPIRSIAAGGWHSCAVLLDGTISCWGGGGGGGAVDRNYGQINPP